MPETEPMERPKLRQVEVLPVEAGGQRQFVLKDAAGWTQSVVVLTPETLFVVSRLDGESTLRDVQEACFRRFQELVPLERLHDVVKALDEALLLDSPRFRDHRAAVEEAFRIAPVRPPAHAGGAYEADPAALRAALDGIVAGAPAASSALPEGRLAGLIAPHIDFHRGGAGYGAAYRALAERCSAGLFVVFGTAHAAPPEPYVGTRKAYGTPLGDVETDRDVVERLSGLYGDRLFKEELLHRGEHSIEFQALMLRHVFPRRPIRIVPILCSSFHDQVVAGGSPRDDGRVADFLGALRESLQGRRDACLIAGADLAHLGPRFGDSRPVADEEAFLCERADRRTLEAAGRRDGEGFFRLIAEEGDRRRVCGVSAIYTLLESLQDGAAGTLLHYGQALDPERTTFVSFASMAFTAA